MNLSFVSHTPRKGIGAASLVLLACCYGVCSSFAEQATAATAITRVNETMRRTNTAGNRRRDHDVPSGGIADTGTSRTLLTKDRPLERRISTIRLLQQEEQQGGPGSDENTQGSFVGLIFLLMCMLGFVLSSLGCYWYQVRTYNSMLSQERTYEAEDSQTRELSKEQMYKRAEKWLSSRKVRSHDEICNLCRQLEQTQAKDLEEGSIQSRNSHDPIQECCPICLTAIEEGDIVSWSSFNPDCINHPISHHQCFKEVLLQKSTCPFCRSSVLFPDDVDTNDLDNQSEGRTESIFHMYCQQHGYHSCILNETEQPKLAEIAQQDIPTTAELINYRGIKQHESCPSEEDQPSSLCT